MYKVSPSKLEAYRHFIQGAKFQTIENLHNSIKGIPVENFAVKFGNAIHDYIEKGEDKDNLLLRDEKRQLDHFREMFRYLLFEKWNKYQIFDDVKILFRTDGLAGDIIHEFKSKRKLTHYTMNSYFDSVQWKLYCLGSRSKTAVYHVFHYDALKDERGNDIRPYSFTHHEFSFNAYKGMEQEMQKLTRSFINYCESNNLTQHITQKRPLEDVK